MISERWLIDVNAIPESATAISADGRLYVAWSAIVNAPIVGAVEVVHGRWEEKYDAFHDMYWTSCSSCHYTGARHFHYCPSCGAKMDLEKILI